MFLHQPAVRERVPTSFRTACPAASRQGRRCGRKWLSWARR